MTLAYLGLGSNLGDRVTLLTEAARRLDGPRSRLSALSSLYETAPQGLTDQPSFLNAVVAVETDLPLIDLLRRVQMVEEGLGRVRTVRWGPRTLDVDILLYGSERSDAPEVEIPHPRLHERAFVLIPMLEINRELRLPPPQRTPLADLLAALPDQGVRRFLSAERYQAQVRLKV